VEGRTSWKVKKDLLELPARLKNLSDSLHRLAGT